MLKRHEVEILLRAGHGKTEVARLTGVPLCSVKRIAEERPVVHVDDAAERAKRQIGRPSTVATFRKQVVEILQETPARSSALPAAKPLHTPILCSRRLKGPWRKSLAFA